MWFDMRPETLATAASAPDQLRNEVVVEASPDELFAILADIEQWPRWFAEIQKGTWDSAPPHGVGSRRTVVLDDLCVREVFLAWEPGQRFAFTMSAGTLPLANWIVEDYQIEPVDGGKARLVWIVSFELRWFVRPIGFFVRRKFGGQFSRAAASLGRYVAERRRSVA